MIPRAAALALLLQACAAPGPGEADRLYREALSRLSRGNDPSEALPLLDRALRIEPSRPDILTARALARRALGRADEALADTTAAVGLLRKPPSPDLPPLLVRRSVLLDEKGRAEEAEADLTEAVRLSPDFTEAWLRRARLRRRAGRDEEAGRDVAGARRAGAPAADAFYNEGVRILNRGDRAEAEILFSFAADLDPRHLQAHVALARVFMEGRRFAEAERSLDRAIEIDPAQAELRHHRGNARLAGGRPREALSDYTEALRLDPRRAPCYAARGSVYHRHLDDTARALEDFARALEIDPSCRAALLESAAVYYRLGNPEAAERKLRQALAISATADALRALGHIFRDRGQYDRAEDTFRNALALCRDEALRKEIEEDLERARKSREEKR